MTTITTTLNDKFIRDYLSKLHSLNLYWSFDKKTYYTEDFVVNTIINAVNRNGIVHIDFLKGLIDCSIKQKALQIAQKSQELGCIYKEFLFNTTFKEDIKALVIRIMKKHSYLTTFDEMECTVMDALKQNNNETQHNVLSQLFEKKQFIPFIDGILISLSVTNVSLHSHWNQQMKLIKTVQCQSDIIHIIPIDTAIMELTAVEKCLADNVLGLNTTLLSYLLNGMSCDQFKLCVISDKAYVVSNRFYDLRLKRIRCMLHNEGYIANDELLHDVAKYLFKNMKELCGFMDKNMIKNRNTSICRISNGYLNRNVLCDKYTDILKQIVMDNNICSEESIYDEYIQTWIGDVDAASLKVLIHSLNSRLKAENDITFINKHWIMNVIPNCIWNQHVQYITKLLLDKNVLKLVLNDGNERAILYRNDCITIVKYVWTELETLDAPFVDLVMDILQKRISDEFRKQKQNRNTLNNDEIQKEWKRLSNIIGKLYEHFVSLLESIVIINVSDEIRSELLHYLLETVFSKIIDTVLIAYGYIIGIGVDLKNNSHQLTKADRYDMLDGISQFFNQNHCSTTEVNKKFSLFFKVKSVLVGFENILEISNSIEYDWNDQLQSIYELSVSLETMSKQLLLSRFIKQSIDRKRMDDNKENDESVNNDKCIAMHSTLKEQFLSTDLSDITNIKPFIQIWIVLYFYEKHNVIVHIPSSLQSIQHILHYLDNNCNIDPNILKLWQCIDNEELLNTAEIEEIVVKLKSLQFE